MQDAPFRIIQISDLHIFADPNNALLGVKTEESLQAVIDHIKQHAGKIDLIILTGDLSQDFSKGAYLRIIELFKSFHLPIYCIPGNHDDPALMESIYANNVISTDRQIVLNDWQMILLDSHKRGSVAGYLEEAELHFLTDCLAAYPNHKAIILFHHHPVLVGSEWLDKLGLTNAPEFWQAISPYPNVHTVLFGHVHQVHEEVVNGIPCYSAPSTCIQFKRKQAHFGLENLPPGYRIIDLYKDRLETNVVRLPHYIGVFDPHAKGY